MRPQYARGPLRRVATGRQQPEAEFIQMLLLDEGIPSTLRRSAGFDVPDMLAAGPRDVLVPESGVEVAREVLATYGVVSRFAIDFLVWRDAPGAGWNLAALEINLRMGGTTHPFLALQFLTGGKLDRTTGLFYSPTGLAKYYRATDNLRSDSYRGLLPEDVIDILTENRLHYSHATDSGVLFHLIGAVSEFGKLGLTAIGNSREEADALYYKTLEVLDRETAYGRRAG